MGAAEQHRGHSECNSFHQFIHTTGNCGSKRQFLTPQQDKSLSTVSHLAIKAVGELLVCPPHIPLGRNWCRAWAGSGGLPQSLQFEWWDLGHGMGSEALEWAVGPWNGQ